MILLEKFVLLLYLFTVKVYGRGIDYYVRYFNFGYDRRLTLKVCKSSKRRHYNLRGHVNRLHNFS